MKQLCAILLVAFAQINLSKLEDPTVKTHNGPVLGRQDITADNTTYYAFEGIPYATPPLGELRFKAPKPVENWEDVLNATHLGTICYQSGYAQTGVTQSEDCLVLNIFTPLLPTDEDQELLPVMLFIHGGGFTSGSSLNYYPDLFVNEWVLLVSIHYRLGPFGFLSTEDDVIPGNNGLKDQILALKWVNKNIHLFGGDPDRVTIFGQSAGAGSVAYHTLNQNAVGLFQGAILESGTFLCPGFLTRDAKKTAFGIGAILNSTFEDSGDSQALLEFLNTVDPEALIDAVNEWNQKLSPVKLFVSASGGRFAPVIEAKNPDAILTRKMYGLLQAGSVLPVPVLLGFNSQEKLAVSHDSLVNITAVLDEHLEYLVPDDMQITDSDDLAAMGAKIRDIYTDGDDLSDHLDEAIELSSDTFMTRAVSKHGQLLADVVDTFFYVFSYEGGSGIFENEGAEGVPHSGEVQYLFCSGQACNDPGATDEYLLERKKMIKLWTNFAKYKNPTPAPEEVLDNIIWPTVSTGVGNFFVYLDIGSKLEVKNHPKGEHYEKWTKLYDSLTFNDFDTY